MRIRINFTIDLDLEEYREQTAADMSKDELRREIQEAASSDVILELHNLGVRSARLLGSNNVYDRRTRTTRSEQLVRKP